MARMTARYCMWTILFLSQLTLFRANAAEASKHNLAFELDALLEIPESDVVNQTPHRFESILQTQCDFLSRYGSTNLRTEEPQHLVEPLLFSRSAENDLPPRPAIGNSDFLVAASINATCPIESCVADLCQSFGGPTKEGANETFGKSWIAIWDFVASRRNYLTQSRRWIEQNVCYVADSVRDYAESTAKLVAFKAIETFNPAVKPTPMTRVSHVKAVSENVVPESVFADEIEVEAGEHSVAEPIQIDDSTDSYWQYYEDCDRWGVNFAILLIQANVINSYCDVSSPAPDPCNSSGEGVSVARILAANWRTAWLNAVPKSAISVQESVRNWIELCEFHFIELESVDLDALNLETKHPWSSVAIELHRRTCSGMQNRGETIGNPPTVFDSGRLVASIQVSQNRVTRIISSIVRKLESERLAIISQLSQQIADRAEWISAKLIEVVGFGRCLSPGSGESIARLTKDAQ